MKNKLKFGSRQYRIDKFGDLIELEISLINEIRGLIKEISKFRADSG
jgi:hypothetical protein